MKNSRRAFVAFSGLAIALSGLTITAAHATVQPFDVGDGPGRTETGQAAGVYVPTDIAVDLHQASGDAPGKIAISDANSGLARIVQLTSNPFNAFNPNSPGNFSPGSQMLGTESGLASPQGITYDDAGHVWVADPGSASVRYFDKDRGPDHGPRSTISGSNTGLSSPYDVAIAKNGDILVSDIGNDRIYIYNKGSGGNVEPDREIISGIHDPYSIAIDSKGLIYVANRYNGADDKITVYAANAESFSDPIRTITGDKTHLNQVYGLALDDADNLYVASLNDDTTGSITVYPAGADGNLFPTKRLYAGNTGINGPTGVAVDNNRNVYVVNQNFNSGSNLTPVSEFAPLIPFVKASAPRSIGVSGSSKSSTRKVTWHSPSAPGDTPITKYLVVVTKGTKILYSKSTTTRTYTLKKSHLSSGTDTVTITAVNKGGSGAAATKTFTVKK